MRYSIPFAVRDASYWHTAVAVTDEDNVGKVLEVQKFDDVLNVCLEINVRAEKVAALPEAGQCRGEDLVAAVTQQTGHRSPDRRTAVRSMNEDECCQDLPPLDD
jgi:hypothetical protein